MTWLLYDREEITSSSQLFLVHFKTHLTFERFFEGTKNCCYRLVFCSRSIWHFIHDESPVSLSNKFLRKIITLNWSVFRLSVQNSPPPLSLPAQGTAEPLARPFVSPAVLQMFLLWQVSIWKLSSRESFTNCLILQVWLMWMKSWLHSVNLVCKLTDQRQRDFSNGLCVFHTKFLRLFSPPSCAVCRALFLSRQYYSHGVLCGRMCVRRNTLKNRILCVLLFVDKIFAGSVWWVMSCFCQNS